MSNMGRIAIIHSRMSKSRVMWGASSLSLDKLPEEGELDVVRHDIRRPLDVSALHQQFQMGHDFVLQLLQPFVH